MQNDSYTQDQAPERRVDGYRPEPPQRRRDLPYKIPFLAGFLSGIFPGIGQLYLGYYRQGIVLAAVFVGVITILAGGDMTGVEPFLGMSLGFIWIYGIIDASRHAQAINRALDGYGENPLPSDMELPGGGGSLVGGAVLVVMGFVMVLHTRFDMDMQWLEDWWPLTLVALGVWLIWKARAEKASAKSDDSPPAV